MVLVAGLWSGHDTSCCVLENGRPVCHIELERHNREKEAFGDSIELLKSHYKDWKKIDRFVGCFPIKKLTQYEESYKSLDRGVEFIGHHQAHAAHAFYSSNFHEANVITIDGGGVEDAQGSETATTSWNGEGNRLEPSKIIPSHHVNIGGLWTRVTRYIFRLQSGWPRGHQAGTVMAMAAFGQHPEKYVEDFRRMLRSDIMPASMKPAGQTNPICIPGGDPVHPYLDPWVKIADRSEEAKFDMAAAFQIATEEYVYELLESFLKKLPQSRNLCLCGGVALNSLMVGKIKKWFPKLENVYVPAVPYDGGLTLGAAQYVTHHLMNIPRVSWKKNLSPYLGKKYEENDVIEAIHENKDKVEMDFTVTDGSVLDLIAAGKIVSVFYGRAESGRRALGHRSIVADPRNPNMKDIVNEKVKHRQWFRPFAPSVLREEVKNWFKEDVDSPYMSFVANFTDYAKGRVPAVVHADGTARLQTVTSEDNGWWYDFIKQWYTKTGVPIVLNTSYNDTSPIVETPAHALDCFLNTEIDYVYFPEYKILISKKQK